MVRHILIDLIATNEIQQQMTTSSSTTAMTSMSEAALGEHAEELNENPCFQVKVPIAAEAGQTIDVQTEDGRNLSITVPNNVKSGQTLTLQTIGTIESGEQVVVVQRQHTQMEKGLGATAAAALITTLIFGPIMGIFAAVATLYANSRTDRYGDVVRNFGDNTCHLYEKAVEVCSHENLSAVGAATVTKLRALDEQYKIKETVVTASVATVNRIADLNEQYKITEKVSELSSNVVEKVRDFTSKGLSRISSGTGSIAIEAGEAKEETVPAEA